MLNKVKHLIFHDRDDDEILHCVQDDRFLTIFLRI